MKHFVGLATASAIVALFMSMPAQAACPGFSHDGKTITLSGRITKIEARAAEYLDGTKATHVVTIRECNKLAILAKRPRGCKVGSTATATGKFFACTDDDFDEGLCDIDEINSSSLTCR